MYLGILRRLRYAVRRKSPKMEKSTVGFSFTTMLQHRVGFGQGFLSKE
jgi:hypothetical protein